MDLGSVAAAYEGLKVGKELLAGIVRVKVEAEVREKVSAVVTKLDEAQHTLYALRDELFRLQSSNEALQRKLVDVENWEKRFGAYKLSNTSGGAVVYLYTDEPAHYVCPACVVKRELQILQDSRSMSGNFRCPGCKSDYPINPRSKPPSVRSHDPYI